MLAAILLGAADTNEIRVMTVKGILDTNGTTSISRNINESHELTYTIQDQWGKNDSWTETFVQSQEAALIRHSFRWTKPNGKNALWSTSMVDGLAQWRTEQYEGETSDGKARATKLSANEVGDPTLRWWNGEVPKEGDQVARYRFVPMFGYEKETITYTMDQRLTFGDVSINVHKTVRTSETLTIVVWLDDEGMPVRREFYQPGRSSVHRVDIWIPKRPN